LRENDLRVSSEYRRRSSKEREYEEELRVYGLQGSRYPGRDADRARQRLRSGRLNDQMSDVAKCAVGLHRLTVCVDVPGLHDPAESDECAAKKAEHYPQGVMCF
jgi:hypothetical protein